MKGLNGLVEMWRNLHLSEEEEDSIVVREDFPEGKKINERRNLVRKIFTDRNISRETIKNTTEKIWRINKQAAFTEVGINKQLSLFKQTNTWWLAANRSCSTAICSH